MTSQISTRKFLLQEIRQNGWMFGLSGLLHLLTGPVTFLLNTSNYKNWTADLLATRYERYASDNFFIWQLFTMMGCLFINIFVYRYLFSKRMVDLYHSVPVSRKQLFAVKYLHGFLIWFLPFILNTGSILLFYTVRTAGKPFFASAIKELLLTTILLIFCYLIFYHLFLTAVYLSGNVLNMMANAVILGCSIICMGLAVLSCAQNYFDTFCYTTPAFVNDIFYGTSPMTTPFYIYAMRTAENLGKHIPLILVSIFTCAFLLYVSRRLCLHRPSELAERGTEIKIYCTLARIIPSLVVGIAGSMFFSSICSQDQTLGWGIFGALLCSVLTFGALNGVYKTTIKAFFRHPLQILTTALASVLIMVTFQLDLLGYDTYLPKKESIEGIAIFSNQFSDGSAYQQITYNSYGPEISYNNDRFRRVTQDTLLTDKDICYDLLKTFTSDESENGYSTVYAKVVLTNGRTYERRYRVSNDNYTILKPFVESSDYLANNYKYSTGELGYPSSLTLEFDDTHIELSPKKSDLANAAIQTIMDAYWADFREHFSFEQEASHMSLFSFSGSYLNADLSSNYFSLDVPLEYERTLGAIRSLYPEQNITIQSVDETTNLYMNIRHFDNFADTDYTLDSLYKYFGYEIDNDKEADANKETESTESENNTLPSAEIATVTREVYQELHINDRETLASIFPILHFGYYKDIFNSQEYIYVGYVRTSKGYTKDCYVKPGVFPKEILEKLFTSTEYYE